MDLKKRLHDFLYMGGTKKIKKKTHRKNLRICEKYVFHVIINIHFCMSYNTSSFC